MTSALDDARTIAALLRERYCGPRGLLARTVDAARGRIVDPRSAVSDLGDYVQYTFLLGQETNDDALRMWSRDQVRRALDLTQGIDGLVRVLAAEAGVAGRLQGAVFAASPATDTLWGIAELVRLTNDPNLHVALERFARAVLRFACGRRSLPAYGGWRVGTRALVVPISNPMLAGMWIESLVQMCRRAVPTAASAGGAADGHGGGWSDAGLTWALEMARALAEHPVFARTGVFPVRCSVSPWGDRLLPLADVLFRLRGRPPSGGTVMAKGSAHLVFGLLALYRLTGEVWLRDVLERWTRAVLGTLRMPDGRFADRWSRTTSPQDVALASNNTAIEVLLDLAHDLSDDEALEAAATAADAWLARRGRAGPVPDRDGEAASLDAQVDLVVNLLKLAELSRRTRWAEAADSLGTATTARYTLPFGLARRVDPATGRILDTVIETKFLGLFLKLPLLGAAVGRSARIFADPGLRRLATDR